MAKGNKEKHLVSSNMRTTYGCVQTLEGNVGVNKFQSDEVEYSLTVVVTRLSNNVGCDCLLG